MGADPLADVRILATSPTLAPVAEYLRALLRVGLAIHDQRAAQQPAPAKRGR